MRLEKPDEWVPDPSMGAADMERRCHRDACFFNSKLFSFKSSQSSEEEKCVELFVG